MRLWRGALVVDENGRPVEGAGLEVLQRLRRLRHRVNVRGGPDVVAVCELQELPAVGPGVGRDAAQFLLVEQLALVVQRRGVGQVDPGHGEHPAPVERPQRHRHQVPDRREQDRAGGTPPPATPPPGPGARSATGTRPPTGANRIALSSGSGGESYAPPADAAPSSSASRWDASPRVSAWTVAPCASATWATRWALSPKPYSPSLPCSGSDARRSAR